MKHRKFKMATNYPCIEIIHPVCTCGSELARNSYQFFAEESFREFMGVMGVNEVPEYMKFSDPKTALNGLKLCCRRTVIFPMIVSIGIDIKTENNVIRKFPEALDKPNTESGTLKWV